MFTNACDNECRIQSVAIAYKIIKACNHMQHIKMLTDAYKTTEGLYAM